MEHEKLELSDACEAVSHQADVDWLEKRRTLGIGASESPIILGLSRWSSPFELYAQKIGATEQQKDTQAMRLGRKHEATIREEYSFERSAVQVKPNCVTYQSRQAPFMLATPDGFQHSEGRRWGSLQIKATSVVWAEEIPVGVWCQVQHEMYVTGLTWATAVGLITPTRMVWQDVERHDQFIDENLIPECKKFWDCVQAREPYEKVSGDNDATKRALQILYPEDEGTTAHLDGSFVTLHRELTRLKEDRKAADYQIKTFENELRAAIGNHSFAVLPNGVEYSLKTVTRKEHTVKGSSYRQLRLKKGEVNAGTTTSDPKTSDPRHATTDTREAI